MTKPVAAPAKLQLSDKERFLFALQARTIPWSGGEDGIVLRYNLETKMQLKAFNAKFVDAKPETLSLEPSFGVSLLDEEVELLVFVLTGAGGSLQGSGTTEIAEMIIKIRAAYPKKTPPK